MRSHSLVSRVIRLTGPLAVAAICGTAAAGPDWVEMGDAGSTIITAQFPRRPLGVSTLNTISGTLSSGFAGEDFEDMYFFRILEPTSFEVSVETADFNPVLYLFDITVNNQLFGRLANDNAPGETNLPRLAAASNDGTGILLTQPGDYLIAIAGFGRAPVSTTGPIFSLASTTEISGPDGLGGLNPLSGWEGVGQQGDYQIRFTSADFPIVPAPTSSILFAVAVAATARRRR